MRTLRSWSVVAVGLLAAACGRGSAPEARTGGETEPDTAAPSEPSAFPAEGEAARAPADEAPSSEGSSARAEAAPAPASPPAGASSPAAKRSGGDTAKGAPQANAESRTRRAIEKDDERPGLGTQWGETRTSHVSNAPFERA
ncbi:MAG TPA: hypothetical protein VFZ53_06720, partial [Polyangiaceae bacterium]